MYCAGAALSRPDPTGGNSSVRIGMMGGSRVRNLGKSGGLGKGGIGPPRLGGLAAWARL